MDLTDLFKEILVLTIGMARMVAVFAMIPVFGRNVLVGSARMVVIVGLTLPLYPMLTDGIDPAAFSAMELGFIVAKEIAIGVLMGFGLSVIFWAVESFGYFIDNQRGSTMASSVDPLTGAQTSPIGIFMMQVVTLFYLVSGAFTLTLLAIYRSYMLLPVDSFIPVFEPAFVKHFLGLLDHLMALALVLAAPAMIAMFLSEFALGMISRFAPQLNVFFLAMPVKSAVGILMLALYVGLLPLVWQEQFVWSLGHLDIVRALVR